jgi:DNA excision repair protein ERCC-2
MARQHASTGEKLSMTVSTRPEPKYPVSVRALCNFTSKRGDLDIRYTPAPSAQEGMEGHKIVASRRGPDYQAEVSLLAEHELLLVRGRADGYDSAARRLDECKTYRGELAKMPGNHRSLHWAQAQTYGAQVCRREGLTEIDLALVYYDIESQEETILQERFTAQTLEQLFTQRCEQFSEWAEHQIRHIESRNAVLADLPFPYDTLHAGQRELAEGVYRAASRGECLMAQAPTGIGKTLGTLFPMLKAMANGKVDKIFFLAAKTTGRQLAFDALQQLQRTSASLRLRALDLVARDKVCLNPGKACNGDSCPLAKGFFDKLPAAREAALACDVMDQSSLRDVGVRHGVCPYYLSQEMVRWSDVVVGDYNYYFDYGGLLHTLTFENEWRVGLLVDEAHNMIERARDMYSGSLEWPSLMAARRAAPASIRMSLDQVAKHWDSFTQRQNGHPYVAYEDIPETLLLPLKSAVNTLNEYAMAQRGAVHDDLQHFLFAALQFCRLAESFAEHSIFDVTLDSKSNEPGTFSIRSVIPGVFLRKRFADAHCTVLFSATLTPRRFYQDILGLPIETRWLDVPSPFGDDQLTVHIVQQISTRFRHRQASLSPLVELIERQFEQQPGNYLVFASSFEYLRRLYSFFCGQNPLISCWAQERSMTERDRNEFIERFKPNGRGIGFAVLGGSFAEGIDLPGTRLIGAFVATLGLPQLNAVNEEMAKRLQEIFALGYEYTYLYPGLRKVAQAAGRVIRTPSDKGTVHLIDDRYTSGDVLSLLPSWWNVN